MFEGRDHNEDQEENEIGVSIHACVPQKTY